MARPPASELAGHPLDHSERRWPAFHCLRWQPLEHGRNHERHMGRDLPVGFFTLLIAHFALSFLYAAVIGTAIYRLRLVPALVAGSAVAMLLYGLNYAIFHGLAIQMQSPETRTILVHAAFGLLASATYKGGIHSQADRW